VKFKNIILVSLLLVGCTATTTFLTKLNIIEDSGIPHHTLIRKYNKKSLLISICKRWLAENDYSLQKEDAYFILAKKEEGDPAKVVIAGSLYSIYADLSFYNRGDSCEITLSTFYLYHAPRQKEYVWNEAEFESLRMKIDSLVFLN
jgi:hypothetical protein